MSEDAAFQWLRDNQIAFDKAKSIITSLKIAQFFDQDKQTELMMDASKLKGLGFALLHRLGREAPPGNLLQPLLETV